MSITYKGLGHTYSPNSPFQYKALEDINLKLEDEKVYAIIGETGSGKSTLVQHLNALLLPTEGELQINDKIIKSSEKPKNLKLLRKEVGLVFQFPEYQLFEETILRDVSFGPKNFGLSTEEAEIEAKKALDVVGIDESYYDKSPFDLSGGQKRRVAIAGIMAMNPSVLVLDEPTAGLDPQGAKEMMELFVKMNREYKKTIIVVTHDMEHVLSYCDEVIVMGDGKLIEKKNKVEFFKDLSLLEKLKINPPHVISLRESLIKKGFNISNSIIEMDELIDCIANEVNK